MRPTILYISTRLKQLCVAMPSKRTRALLPIYTSICIACDAKHADEQPNILGKYSSVIVLYKMIWAVYIYILFLRCVCV